MAANITLPPGAFAAAKTGQPQPAAAAPKDGEAAGGKEALKPAQKEAPKAPEKKKDAAPAPSAKKDDAAPPMTAAEKKVWKLKADGEEFEFDATDEEAVKREIMRARGADKRFREAMEERQRSVKLVEALKDPASLRQILTDPRIGVDVRKFAEQVVWEQIEQQKREEEWAQNPAAKAQWEREQKLREYEAREESQKKTAEAAQFQQQTQKHAQEYNARIVQALEAGGIPKTPAAVGRMAEYLQHALEHGYDLSTEDLVQQVKNDYASDLKAILGAADGDQLIAIIGEEVAKKIRDADLKRLKSTQSNPFPDRPRRAAADKKEESAAPKRVSGSDWKADLIKGFLGREK